MNEPPRPRHRSQPEIDTRAAILAKRAELPLPVRVEVLEERELDLIDEQARANTRLGRLEDERNAWKRTLDASAIEATRTRTAIEEHTAQHAAQERLNKRRGRHRDVRGWVTIIIAIGTIVASIIAATRGNAPPPAPAPTHEAP